MSIDELQNIASLRNGAMILTRLKWIDEQLLWMGEFNRTELVYKFGISTQQASSDINRYQELAPDNFVLDYRYKAFCATDSFSPVFDSNPITWLQNNTDELNQRISFENVEGVPQFVEPHIFRALNQCHKRNIPAIIKMTSLKQNEVITHMISPHSVVATTLRWHVRGWDHDNHLFGDFPLTRIREVTPSDSRDWVSSVTDNEWNTYVDIIITPSNGLSPLQRESLSKSFGMVNGRLTIPVRQCLAYYRLASMQLLSAIREYKGRAVDPNLFITVENWESLRPLVQSLPDPDVLAPLGLENDFDRLRNINPTYVAGRYSVSSEPRMLWLGAGLSKIAASYADELCQHNDINSSYNSYLSLINHPGLNKKTPVIISIAGKHEDAVNAGKLVSSKCVDVGVVSCDHASELVKVLETCDVNIHGAFIPFPERDKRFINIRSVITLSQGVECYVKRFLNIDVKYQRISEAVRLQAAKVSAFLAKIPSFSEKNVIILTNGDHGMLQETWRSLLCESGVHSPMFFDIKDYTHGDHRYASIRQNCFYIVLSTPDIKKFVDIFTDRFSELFYVHVIDLPQPISERFWSNLYIALHMTHAMSCYLGYQGSRPEKNALVHSWRGWGEIHTSNEDEVSRQG
ncbi:hypothetical protein [Atlantibacter subterraneus]|uniref:hypothetical protein n=1 Tax=Atlantibacter subterraneus TaxID=255519 RepID=UPI0028A177DF|nr:hypothetical protein [Atlantibacter subterranea]